MNDSCISLIILSLFCSGGLYAYIQEALRLQRLISSGVAVHAILLKKEKINLESESVTHFLVSYEFVDDQGKTTVHKQDLNSRKFFNTLSIGDEIEILYQKGSDGNSYPLSQIRVDCKIARWISVIILLFWGIMSMIFIS